MSANIKVYICDGCGGRYYVPRRAERERGEGHKKDMWCVKCGDFTKFTESNYVTLDSVVKENKALK